MPAINVATMRLRVQRSVGLAGGTAGDEQTLIDGWYNEAVEQFLVLTKIKKKTANIALTAGQGDYVLDDDILAFEDAFMNPGDGSEDFMLSPTDSHEIRRMRQYETSVPGPPGYYAYEAQALMLYPTPATNDKLHIVFVERPTAALAATGDDPSQSGKGEIPVEYHHILESYVKWKAGEYSNDQPSGNGQQHKEDWLRGITQAKITENRKGGVRVGYAKVGRRMARIPRSPGVDLGY